MSEPITQDTVPTDFRDWLANQIGTSKWIVARRSKKRVEVGFDLFITQTRFTALQRHFWKETGEMENDLISKHLTEPDVALGQKRKDTFSGMAFWAGTGPDGKTCRGCTHWRADGYMASSGLLKDSICGKYKSMMHGAEGLGVPHYAKACKYFDETAEARPLEKPRGIPVPVGTVGERGR